MKSPKRILAVLALACAANVPVYADCILPSAPSKVPDAATASEQEMITAMKTLKQYNGDVETYLKCLEFEEKQNHITRADEERMHNTAVDTLQKIAAKFNEQVRNFKTNKSG
jgi:hypothetical protein